MRKMELAILKHIALISCFLTLTKTAEEPTTFIKWKKMNVSTPIFKDWLNKAMLIAGVNNMHVKNLTEVYMGKEGVEYMSYKMKFDATIKEKSKNCHIGFHVAGKVVVDRLVCFSS
ncbi:hypothetical protein GE061_007879 [Apolygus lucorum]|uniref:Cystatin domain-containing protein n=1 Tax=Apolygus lucorum TaxID=248454 RepID=A0A8S9WMR3_APOLU|nr:hypothetical protein GE061_007879 [Apolygus lucorum]